MKHYQVFLNNKKLDMGDCRLYEDDTINIVLKKLGYVLKVPWVNLYAWHNMALNDVQKTAMVRSFVTNVFQSNKTVPVARLDINMYHLFGVRLGSAAIEQRNMVDQADALDLVDTAVKNVRKVVEPLGFKYVYDEYMSYVPYNVQKDFSDTFNIEEANVVVNNQLSTTIGSYDIKDRTIYLVTKTDQHPSYLFPFVANQKQNEDTLKNTHKLVKDLVELESALEDVDISDFDVDKYLNFVNLKVSSGTLSRIDLSRIFEYLHTSETMTFIKLKLRTNAFFKVYKKYVEDLIVDKDTYRKLVMVAKTAASKSSNVTEYLIIRFLLNPNKSSYATLVLREDGSYDLRMNFSIKSRETQAKLSGYIRVINRVILNIVESTRTFLVTIPDDLFDTQYQDVKVDKMVCFGIITSKTNAFKSKNFESIVNSKLYPYFDIIASDDPNTLHLQYKKVDNYTQYNNLKYYIAQHHNLDRDELVNRLSTNFSLTVDEAKRSLELWLIENEVEVVQNGRKKYFKPKYDTFVNAKIRLSSSFELKFLINGATSFGSFDRISELLKMLSKLSSNKYKAKDQGYAKLFDDVKVVQTMTFADLMDQDDGDELIADASEMSDEIDEELAALEAEFAEEDDGAKSDEINVAVVAKKKNKGVLLSKLQEADTALFGYSPPETAKRTDYASMCSVARQPVVVTKQELDLINKNHPDALQGHVQTGSTPELAQNNYYVCPRIWCPKSRIALSYDEYKKAGFKCRVDSDVDETPILFVKESDKRDAKALEGKLNKKFYPTYLDAFIHPQKLCLPCCFSTAPAKGNKNEKRQNMCVSNRPDVNLANDDDSVVGNEKYIKGENYFPLEVARFGLPSKDIAAALGNEICGSRHDGTGLMKNKMSCFLRKGIDHGNQSFLSCVAYMLGLGGGKEALKSLLLKNLTIDRFIALEDGRLAKLFIDENVSIRDKATFASFKAWFLENQKYITRFSLEKVRSMILRVEAGSSKELVREFLLWSSYTKFMRYLADDSHTKDYRLLMDLLNMNLAWLNPNKILFMIIDVDPVTNKSFIVCPSRHLTEFETVSFVIKRGPYFEPLVQVDNASKLTLDTKKTFDVKSVKSIMGFFLKNCTMNIAIDNRDTSTKNCKGFLESQGEKVWFMVINYDFKVCGIMLKTGLYVPLLEPEDIFNNMKDKYIYYSDIASFKCLLERKDIAKVYRSVENYLNDDRYKISAWISGNAGFLVNNSEEFVPLNLKPGSRTYRKFQDDLDIFIGDEDLAGQIIKKLEAAFESDSNMKAEFAFLFDRGNPIPIDYRKKQLTNLLSKVAAMNVDDELLESVTRKIIMYLLPALPGSSFSKRFTASHDEYLLSYKEIRSNKLQMLWELQKNPYKYISEKLDTIEVSSYSFNTDTDLLVKGMHDTVESLGLIFDIIPTKYRKYLKDWHVARPHDYDRDWFATLLCHVSGGKLDLIILNANLQRVIMQSDMGQLAEMKENPCYLAFWKKSVMWATRDSYLEAVKELNYFPSIFEAKTYARVLGVNLIVDRRASTIKKIDGFEVEMIPDEPNAKYMFIKLEYNRISKRDELSVFVKNKKQVLFRMDEFPEEFQEIVRLKAMGTFEIEVDE
jgi:hypothetical protein